MYQLINDNQPVGTLDMDVYVRLTMFFMNHCNMDFAALFPQIINEPISWSPEAFQALISEACTELDGMPTTVTMITGQPVSKAESDLTPDEKSLLEHISSIRSTMNDQSWVEFEQPDQQNIDEINHVNEIEQAKSDIRNLSAFVAVAQTFDSLPTLVLVPEVVNVEG